MNERGFHTIRKGKKRTSCYAISKNSGIVELLEPDCKSRWLNYGDLVGGRYDCFGSQTDENQK